MEQIKNYLKNKTPFKLPLRVYLSYLLILTLIFTAVSFAKFASSGGSADGARAASFAVSTAPNPQGSLSASFDDAQNGFNGSKSLTYTVTVRNYDDDKASEVALSYEIIVKTQDGKPLPDGIKLSISGATLDSSLSAQGIYTFSSSSFTLPATAKKEAKPELVITTASESITQNLSQYKLNISVRFEQID